MYAFRLRFKLCYKIHPIKRNLCKPTVIRCAQQTLILKVQKLHFIVPVFSATKSLDQSEIMDYLKYQQETRNTFDSRVDQSARPIGWVDGKSVSWISVYDLYSAALCCCCFFFFRKVGLRDMKSMEKSVSSNKGNKSEKDFE